MIIDPVPLPHSFACILFGAAPPPSPLRHLSPRSNRGNGSANLCGPICSGFVSLSEWPDLLKRLKGMNSLRSLGRPISAEQFIMYERQGPCDWVHRSYSKWYASLCLPQGRRSPVRISSCTPLGDPSPNYTAMMIL
jgi:hypothetical protein